MLRIKENKRRFCLSLLIIALLIALQIASVSSLTLANAEYPADIQRIFDRGELIVGVYAGERPPFFMEDEEGELYGLDVEIAEGIAAELDVELNFNREAESFAELYELVRDQEVDMVLSKFSKTSERLRAIKFTEPYIVFRWAVLLNSEYATQQGIVEYPMDHLREDDYLEIGVVGGTSWEEFAVELFGEEKIVGLRDWQEVIAALSAGDIVAALYDENEVIRSIYQNPDIALFANTYVLEDREDKIAIGLPRESQQLQAWLDYYLASNNLFYTVSDLLDKYPEIYE